MSETTTPSKGKFKFIVGWDGAKVRVGFKAIRKQTFTFDGQSHDMVWFNFKTAEEVDQIIGLLNQAKARAFPAER